jgi:hypothetical protein
MFFIWAPEDFLAYLVGNSAIAFWYLWISNAFSFSEVFFLMVKSSKLVSRYVFRRPSWWSAVWSLNEKLVVKCHSGQQQNLDGGLFLTNCQCFPLNSKRFYSSSALVWQKYNRVLSSQYVTSCHEGTLIQCSVTKMKSPHLIHLSILFPDSQTKICISNMSTCTCKHTHTSWKKPMKAEHGASHPTPLGRFSLGRSEFKASSGRKLARLHLNQCLGALAHTCHSSYPGSMSRKNVVQASLCINMRSYLENN